MVYKQQAIVENVLLGKIVYEKNYFICNKHKKLGTYNLSSFIN